MPHFWGAVGGNRHTSKSGTPEAFDRCWDSRFEAKSEALRGFRLCRLVPDGQADRLKTMAFNGPEERERLAFFDQRLSKNLLVLGPQARMTSAAPRWGAGTGHGLHLDARLMPFKTCPPPDGHLTDCQPVRGAKGLRALNYQGPRVKS